MDSVHKKLNVLVPLFSLIVLPFILPCCLLWRLLQYIKRSIFIEDVAGKVVLITGASSGIGEYLAYEYAKRRACLVLVARREERLRAVAEKAKRLGSQDVIVIPADVSKEEDCKRFVDEAVNHFGRLDHLVNNAGKAQTSKFEEAIRSSDYASIMDINFWGSVHSTHLALPHLRRSKGKIIVIASCAGFLSAPRLSIYCASKAALISFYETLRLELGSDIGITIVAPGFVESEITYQEEFQKKVNPSKIPMVSTEGCARAILNSTCKGEKYLIEPAWMRIVLFWNSLCPEVLQLSNLMLDSQSKSD